jgi:hypothetical protein
VFDVACDRQQTVLAGERPELVCGDEEGEQVDQRERPLEEEANEPVLLAVPHTGA